MPTSGPFVPIGDMRLFKNLREKYGSCMVNPIAITVLVVAKDYVDENVVNTSKETWIKGRDILLTWMKGRVRHLDSVEKIAAADLIMNWDDGHNNMFSFSSNYEEGIKYKRSNQHEWISHLSTFSELIIRNSVENIARDGHTLTKIAGVLDTL